MGNSASHPNGPNGSSLTSPGSQQLSPPNGHHQHHSSATGGGGSRHRPPSESRSPRRPSPKRGTSAGSPRPSSSSAQKKASGAAGGAGTSAASKNRRSIELPDLHLNSPPGGAAIPQRVSSTIRSAPIPIPNAGGTAAMPSPPVPQGRGQQPQQQQQNTDVTSDTDLGAGPSSLVVPPPPPLAPTANIMPPVQTQVGVIPNIPSKIGSNASFGRREKKVPKRQKAYAERTVRSMLYSGVPTAHDGIVNVIAPVTAPKVQVQLLYPGQAGSVSVSGTYETSWDIRTDLQYDEAKRMWSTQVHVSPAAYHIKFLVDGVWRTSDALPLATDSGGRLVNYIDVRTKGPEIKEWGKDWWGVGTEDEEDQEQGAWTIKPPAYLEKAATLEEQEETLRRNQQGSNSQSPNGHPRRHRILPLPPQLPRHLDKVILNARPPSSTVVSTLGDGGAAREARASSFGSNSAATGTSPGERGRTAWPSPMTGLSPGANDGPGKPPSKSRRDSAGGSGGSADRSGSGVKNRRGSSSLDVGVYGGLIVSEGGGMTGFGAGIGSPIGDDNSVLPLPSHSVVNHLATSAIRNGVLAVATTTRYKAKYISTVYYRPTHPEDSPEEEGGGDHDGEKSLSEKPLSEKPVSNGNPPAAA